MFFYKHPILLTYILSSKKKNIFYDNESFCSSYKYLCFSVGSSSTKFFNLRHGSLRSFLALNSLWQVWSCCELALACWALAILGLYANFSLWWVKLALASWSLQRMMISWSCFYFPAQMDGARHMKHNWYNYIKL